MAYYNIKKLSIVFEYNIENNNNKTCKTESLKFYYEFKSNYMYIKEQNFEDSSNILYFFCR